VPATGVCHPLLLHQLGGTEHTACFGALLGGGGWWGWWWWWWGWWTSLTVLRKTLGARMMTGVLRILCVCARVCGAFVCVGPQAESEVASLLYRCSKLTDEVVYLRRLLMGRGPGAHLGVLVPANVGVYPAVCVWVPLSGCLWMHAYACASVPLCASVRVHVHVPGTCACV
jgi:hypothetical protein